MAEKDPKARFFDGFLGVHRPDLIDVKMKFRIPQSPKPIKKNARFCISGRVRDRKGGQSTVVLAGIIDDYEDHLMGLSQRPYPPPPCEVLTDH